MGPEIVLGFVGLLALVWKFIDFLRALANFATQKSAVVTQVTAWVGGVVGVMLFAHSNFGTTVTVGDMTLDKYDGTSLLILGLMISSAASAAVDYKQARDNNDDASKPPLIK